MLVQFTVSNYRSFRDSQTFSMVSSPRDHSLPDSLTPIDVAGLRHSHLLKGAAIYGSNASGKSNLLSALEFMSDYVKDSATRKDADRGTGVRPFMLDGSSRERPSEFEITVLVDGIRYDYGFSLSLRRVVKEFLIAYPKGQPQRWFERTFDSASERYDWKTSRTNFPLDERMKGFVRDDALLLSVAAQLNDERVKPVFGWFKNRLRTLHLSGEWALPPSTTARFIEEDDAHSVRASEMLKAADLGVSTTRIEHESVSYEKLPAELTTALRTVRPDETDGENLEILSVTLGHKCSDDEVRFLDLDEESAGTTRFFSLIGPWMQTLDHGLVVLVDELETSLHPLLVRELLRTMMGPENARGAQLVFTTHNPTLLDQSVLRRDQIWFTERDDCGVSELYPLIDYSPRVAESLERGYLAGRYGAIPRLGQLPAGIDES